MALSASRIEPIIFGKSYEAQLQFIPGDLIFYMTQNFVQSLIAADIEIYLS